MCGKLVKKDLFLVCHFSLSLSMKGMIRASSRKPTELLEMG